jgi:hypothetical protein
VPAATVTRGGTCADRVAEVIATKKTADMKDGIGLRI